MALIESVELDISSALRQLAVLEDQLDQLTSGVTVPVTVTEDQSLEQLQREINALDAEQVSVDVDATGVAQAANDFDRLDRELEQTEQGLQEVRREADRTGDELAETGRRGASAFGEMRSAFGGFVAAIAAAQSLRVLTRFLGDAVTAASNLEQAIGGVESVFGDASQTVLEFGRQAAEAVGLSEAAALQLTTVLGGQLQTFGFNATQAADEAQRLVEVGADLAATYGGPVQDAVEAISSLLRGEINPIERYAVSINQAAVKAEALRLGLTNSNAELTIQQRAMAALSLLNQQSANAQGQFAREAETTAGQLSRLQAEAGDLQVAIGQELVPAFDELVAAGRDVVAGAENLVPLIGEMAQSFTDTVGPAVDLAGAFGSLAANLDAFGAAGEGPGIFSFIRESLLDMIPFRQVLQGVLPLVNDLTALLTGTDPQAMEAVFDNLAEGAERGRRPLALLDESLRDLTDAAELNEEVIRRLQETTGATDAQFAQFLDRVLARSETLGLTAEEIEAITLALRDARNSAFGAALARDLGLAGAAGEGLVADLEEVPDLLGILAQAAQDAGVSLDFLVSNAALFGSDIQFIVDQLGSANIAADLLAEGFANLGNSITLDTTGAVDSLDLLITKTNEAGEEVPATMEEMVADLQEQANKLAELEAGTTALEALGFDKLAAEIREKGPEAVGALEGFLNDLDKAAEAERILTEGGNPGEDFIAAIEEAIEQGEVTPALLDYLSGITSQEVKSTVLSNAFDLATLFGEEFQSVLNGLDITLPANVVSANLGNIDVNASRAADARSAQGGNTFTPQGNIEVIINNATTQDLNTDAARAAQTIGAVINAGRNFAR